MARGTRLTLAGIGKMAVMAARVVRVRMVACVLGAMVGFVPLSLDAWADVADRYVPTSEYFGVAMSEIGKAQSSIDIWMYIIQADAREKDSQPRKLLDALIEAKNRGVKVRVVLEQSLDIKDEYSESDVLAQPNQSAYELLKAGGVEVYFDSPGNKTHAKLIVIDRETTIIGSANWSKAALTRNFEANALIKDKAFAEEVLKDLSQIKTQEAPQSLTPSVQVPMTFPANKKLMGEMATQADERALETYLYLLSLKTPSSSEVVLDYGKAANFLGINKMTPEDYRRQINKVLDKLQNKYKLLTYLPPARNQHAQVTLKLSETQDYFDLPVGFFRYRWNQRLSLPGQVMLLIHRSKLMTGTTSWFKSRKEIAKDYGISESFISDGNMDLRRNNLLDIQYGELESQNYKDRAASIYTPKPIYDPKELEKDLASIKAKAGEAVYGKAVGAAKLVYADNDPKAIRAFVGLHEKHGPQVFEEALGKIGEKNPDNPKRSVGYLIKTISGIGKNQIESTH
jgi:HKD family nuclease